LGEDRSQTGIVYSALDVKRWMMCMPTVDEVRPACCPWCGNASRQPGCPLGVIGHGLRERQQRGPLEPDTPPTTIVISIRRYLCVACCSVMTVVPRGMLARKHYAATALAFALCLFGVLDKPKSEVRRRTSPWQIVGEAVGSSWATLDRWIADARRGALWPGGALPPEWTRRQVAARVAQWLIAAAPPSLAGAPLEAQALLGAVHMR
jgi:hypothetical protein